MSEFIHLRVPDTNLSICGLELKTRLVLDEQKITCPRCKIAGSSLNYRTAQFWGGLNFFNEMWDTSTGETLVSSLIFFDRRSAVAAMDGLLDEVLRTNPYVQELARHHGKKDDWFSLLQS